MNGFVINFRRCFSRVPSKKGPSDLPFVSQVPREVEPDEKEQEVENMASITVRQRILNVSHPVDISLEGIRNWATRNQWADHVRRYTFDTEMIRLLGPELSAAYFIVAKGGAIKFSNSNRWFSMGGDYTGYGNLSKKVARTHDQLVKILPTSISPGQSVEAINVSGLPLVYESFTAFQGCTNLHYLDISNCEYVDDWCLNKLHFQHKSLRYLDISGCKKVTDRGVASLVRLSQLTRLIMNDLPHITDNKIFMAHLESVLPNCQITPSVSYEMDNTDEGVENN